MAEGLFRRLTASQPGFQIGSAGVDATPGQAPSLDSVEAMRRLGIDISSYRARLLDDSLVEEADFIFLMTTGHLMRVHDRFPAASEKTFLVREFEDGDGWKDVPDPIGQGIQAYTHCRDTLQEVLPGVLQFVQQSAQAMTMNPTPTTPAPEISTDPASNTKTLRVAIGNDHGGVDLKKSLISHLLQNKHDVTDFGTDSTTSVDYPDFAGAVCRALIAGEADFGVLICRTGIGMSIAANRFPSIRAAVVTNADLASIARHHNNANVLCMGAGQTGAAEGIAMLEAFLTTPFDGGRHAVRVEKMSHSPGGAAGPDLTANDPDIAVYIEKEAKRQHDNIELIASENFTSRAVMQAQGSILTNKYAEGYPGKRWYGGCENVDEIESLAIARAKELFKADHANVQPHSGSQANAAVYFSVLQHGDRILTMDLSHGGHLTHGNKANFSGRFYDVVHYGVSEKDERIDYDQLARMAEESRPKLITIGASAYSRIIDFPRMREIADSVGALLFADMAHISGLVAAGVHPSPVPYADFVTSTTHKSLRGPRGGIILCKEKFAKDIDSLVFPGVQGGPLMHVIAAKAVCFQEALQPEFTDYQQQIVKNAKALSARLSTLGYRIVSGGTDNHLMLVDLRPFGLTGKEAQETLDEAGITVNKNAIPFDTLSVFKTGGIRIGTPAVTTRGMREEEMMEIADLIHAGISSKGDLSKLHEVRETVRKLTAGFPLP